MRLDAQMQKRKSEKNMQNGKEKKNERSEKVHTIIKRKRK